LQPSDNFIKVPFSKENLDRYFVRNSILNALSISTTQLRGNLLDIGCGKMPYKQYILENSKVINYTGLDIENALEYDAAVKPDFTWDGITMPFENDSFETAFGTEVLEHCPKPEIVLNEVYRVLKPSGCFFFTVPFLWPLHEVPHDEYRYTPWALERYLQSAGFREIELKPLGGWHASMAQMLGLWVRRAPMTDRKRNFLSKMIKPVMKKLIKLDRFSKVEFNESQMITGLYGIARK